VSLSATIANLSKERGCFTDFPFPKGREPSHLLRKQALTHHVDCPIHPTAAHVQRYLEDYAEHFSLRPWLRLGTRVQRVRYNRESCAWDLAITKPGGVSAQESFDKVVVASGILRENNVPIIEGIGRFKGQVFDSHTFKK
jgi:dimethylaniline monooxygenase (N-oxide forming)